MNTFSANNNYFPFQKVSMVLCCFLNIISQLQNKQPENTIAEN